MYQKAFNLAYVPPCLSWRSQLSHAIDQPVLCTTINSHNIISAKMLIKVFLNFLRHSRAKLISVKLLIFHFYFVLTFLSFSKIIGYDWLNLVRLISSFLTKSSKIISFRFAVTVPMKLIKFYLGMDFYTKHFYEFFGCDTLTVQFINLF